MIVDVLDSTSGRESVRIAEWHQESQVGLGVGGPRMSSSETALDLVRANIFGPWVRRNLHSGDADDGFLDSGALFLFAWG